MIYGSVCSGIEAATVAWHSLGWKASFFSEIDAFPRAVLTHHYPDVPLHGDFTTITEGMYDPINLLVGGTPCQAFSVAGLRKGLADERGNLTLEFIRLAQRLKPQWLVWENVPGVLSIDGGRAFGSFLGGLAECGYGYAYRVLDAQHFRVPQRRRRVYVIGYLGDWRPPAAVLFERESLRRDLTPSREERERVAPSLDGRAGRSGENEFNTSGGLIETVGTLCADAHPEGYSGQDAYTGRLIPHLAHSLRGEGFDGSEDGTGRGIPIVTNTLISNGDAHSGFRDEKGLISHPINMQVATRYKSLGERTGLGIGEDGDPAFTLQSSHHHAVSTSNCSGHGYWRASGDVAATLRSQDSITKADTLVSQGFQASQSGVRMHEISATLRGSTGGGVHDHGILNAMSVRRLTPRECERLQGFPDDYTLIPYGGRGGYAADGPRYKALGNSMPRPVMYWLGQRIEFIQKQGGPA